MAEHSEQIRWGTERRLEFIEFRVFWDGSINRGDITEYFGVSVPQASGDLSLYQKNAPDNLEYDASAKHYVRSAKFRPLFLQPNADRYLAQLRGIADGILRPEDTWMAQAVTVDAMSLPQRRVSAEVLRDLLLAVRKKQAVDIRYQSMNPAYTDLMWRRITPHAFGFDGVRWHVRSFCHIDSVFKDFVLSRCYEVANYGEPGSSPDQDSGWNTFITVELAPNPGLSEMQQRAIAHDYCMEKGRVSVSIRQALLFYFNRHMRLDIQEYNPEPKQNPVVVLNRLDFSKALEVAKRQS